MGPLWFSFAIQVVYANIPIIMGIRDMENITVFYDNIADMIIHKGDGTYTNAIRFRGHEFVKWDPHLQSNFTKQQGYIDYTNDLGILV